MTVVGENVLLKAILEADPNAIFVLDQERRIVALNRKALEISGEKESSVLMTRGGDALHCIHSYEGSHGCESSESCNECVVQSVIRAAVEGNRSERVRARMTLHLDENEDKDVVVLLTATPFDFEGTQHVLLVLEDVSEFMELRDLLPICAFCKKVRDDDNYWSGVEHYISEHLDLDFSHGYCPDCAQKILDELDDKQ